MLSLNYHLPDATGGRFPPHTALHPLFTAVKISLSFCHASKFAITCFRLKIDDGKFSHTTQTFHQPEHNLGTFSSVALMSHLRERREGGKRECLD